uniref:Uncharacterized protein n=1 Tax=Alexandrium monilatum TaxID=311494 RepID=A0A7S4R4Y8_9DINO|mmetsp:Transcript_8967/g.27235  ORF Transcript_8967/g.27235 Transcript_8967/m.27235 type:complete len:327 (+) Transcript_8967:116-1096(+)
MAMVTAVSAGDAAYGESEHLEKEEEEDARLVDTVNDVIGVPDMLVLDGEDRRSPAALDGDTLASLYEQRNLLISADGDETLALALDTEVGSAPPASRRQRPSRAASSPVLPVPAGYIKKSNPLKLKPPFLPPRTDKRGFVQSQPSKLQHREEWNEAHHLTGLENHLLPQTKRRYFARPQTQAELVSDLARNGGKNSRSILATLSQPDVSKPRRTKLSADGGPPVIPERHMFGGAMRDRDGSVRAWNDRWQRSMSQMNDQCHPDHRAYFTQRSLFEASPSQQYRRYMDQEIAHGTWVPVAQKKAELFPPMGGRLSGRSGAPIPGATP